MGPGGVGLGVVSGSFKKEGELSPGERPLSQEALYQD